MSHELNDALLSNGKTNERRVCQKFKASTRFSKLFFASLIRELDIPQFHHELVKQAVVLAADLGETEINLSSVLLKTCLDKSELIHLLSKIL